MTELQSKLLEMLSWFHGVCVENNLRYYLSSGTMLGAARHGGFIPWDDDVDVMMPRADIRKLGEILSGKEGKYVLEGPDSAEKDYFYPLHKLYDTETTLIENTKKKIKRGIYIDIFPLDGMGNTEEEAAEHLAKIRKRFNLLLCKVTGFRKGRSLYKNLAVALFRCIPLPAKRLLKRVVSLCAARGFDEVELSGNPVGAYGMREIMPRAVYGTPTPILFEGVEVYGVEQYDEYLTRLYKDWRKLPPKEKQVSHHDFILLDLEKSYLEKVK